MGFWQAGSGVSVTRDEILKKANEMVREIGRDATLQISWVDSFFWRKPNLHHQQTATMAKDRLHCLIPEICQLYEDLKEYEDYPDCVVWNMDKSGVAEAETTTEWTISRRGSRWIVSSQPAARRWTTFFECSNAAGDKGTLARP